MANCKAGRTAEMWGGLTVWEKQEGRQHYISFRNFACLTLLSEMWKQLHSENWAPLWELSHIMSREASAFSNMKCKCVFTFRKARLEENKNVYPAPCRSNDYAVDRAGAPHISGQPPHTTPTCPKSSTSPKIPFSRAGKNQIPSNQSFKWAFWGATYVWAAEPD